MQGSPRGMKTSLHVALALSDSWHHPPHLGQPRWSEKSSDYTHTQNSAALSKVRTQVQTDKELMAIETPLLHPQNKSALKDQHRSYSSWKHETFGRATRIQETRLGNYFESHQQKMLEASTAKSTLT